MRRSPKNHRSPDQSKRGLENISRGINRLCHFPLDVRLNAIFQNYPPKRSRRYLKPQTPNPGSLSNTRGLTNSKNPPKNRRYQIALQIGFVTVIMVVLFFFVYIALHAFGPGRNLNRIYHRLLFFPGR